MYNGLDEYVHYCAASELHGSMAYAAHKVVHVAPKRYDPVDIGHFLAQLLADTIWAVVLDRPEAVPHEAPKRKASERPGRPASNPVIRPKPER